MSLLGVVAVIHVGVVIVVHVGVVIVVCVGVAMVIMSLFTQDFFAGGDYAYLATPTFYSHSNEAIFWGDSSLGPLCMFMS
jgi:hypothetical protein